MSEDKARSGGDLGWFGHGMMHGDFEKIAFNLPVRRDALVDLCDRVVTRTAILGLRCWCDCRGYQSRECKSMPVFQYSFECCCLAALQQLVFRRSEGCHSRSRPVTDGTL